MRPIRHLLALVLTAVAATLGLIVQTTGPAAACSCATGDLAQHARWADAVFTGQLSDAPRRGGQTITYTFEVDRVYAGDVAAVTQVRTGSQSTACGMQHLEPGRTYVVFASGSHDRLSTNACSGTQVMGAASVDRLEQRLGAGSDPVDARKVTGSDDPSDDSGPGLLLAIGGLSGALILGALVVGGVRYRRMS